MKEWGIMEDDKLKHPAAVALGKLNKGVPKRISDQERENRAQRMAYARSKRHPIRREAGK